MNWRLIWIILIAFEFLSQFGIAQTIPELEFYGGGQAFSAALTSTERLRADRFSGSTDKRNLRSTFNGSSFGTKALIFLPDQRFRIGIGIQYSKMSGSIDSRQFFYDQLKHFYYKVSETGTTTEYAQVNKLTQISEYIGVPLDLRFFPLETRRFNFYMKVAGEINFRVTRGVKIDFVDSDMQSRVKEIDHSLPTVKGTNAFLYFAPGFQLGKPGKLKFGLEIPLPSICLKPASSGIVKPTSGGGLVLSVAIPLTTSINE